MMEVQKRKLAAEAAVSNYGEDRASVAPGERRFPLAVFLVSLAALATIGFLAYFLMFRSGGFGRGGASIYDASSFAQLLNSGDLKNPSDVIVDPIKNLLYIADTGNHRVVVHKLSSKNEVIDAKIDAVLGQEFSVNQFEPGGTPSTGEHASGSTHVDNKDGGLSGPTSLSLNQTGSQLYVADTGNDRVLVYMIPTSGPTIPLQGMTAYISASTVIGQTSLQGKDDHSGAASRTELSEPQGVSYMRYNDGREMLAVADTGNNRVLVFDARPAGATSQYVCGSGTDPLAIATTGLAATNAQASCVLGQTDFVSKAVASGESGMNAPKGVSFRADGKILLIADTGNNRVTLFDARMAGVSKQSYCSATQTSGLLVAGHPAGCVWGQDNFQDTTGVGPDKLNGPSDIQVDNASGTQDTGNQRFFVADTGNNRVVMFDFTAYALEPLVRSGQAYNDPYGIIDGLNNPRGVYIDGYGTVGTNGFGNQRLYIADSGNDRVEIYDLIDAGFYSDVVDLPSQYIGAVSINLSNIFTIKNAQGTVRYEIVGESNPIPECSDGTDNDDDGTIDFPNDPECTDALDYRESTSPVTKFDKEMMPYTGASGFRVEQDPDTGDWYLKGVTQFASWHNDPRYLFFIRIIDEVSGDIRFFDQGRVFVPAAPLGWTDCLVQGGPSQSEGGYYGFYAKTGGENDVSNNQVNPTCQQVAQAFTANNIPLTEENGFPLGCIDPNTPGGVLESCNPQASPLDCNVYFGDTPGQTDLTLYGENDTTSITWDTEGASQMTTNVDGLQGNPLPPVGEFPTPQMNTNPLNGAAIKQYLASNNLSEITMNFSFRGFEDYSPQVRSVHDVEPDQIQVKTSSCQLTLRYSETTCDGVFATDAIRFDKDDGVQGTQQLSWQIPNDAQGFELFASTASGSAVVPFNSTDKQGTWTVQESDVDATADDHIAYTLWITDGGGNKLSCPATADIFGTGGTPSCTLSATQPAQASNCTQKSSSTTLTYTFSDVPSGATAQIFATLNGATTPFTPSTPVTSLPASGVTQTIYGDTQFEMVVKDSSGAEIASCPTSVTIPCSGSRNPPQCSLTREPSSGTLRPGDSVKIIWKDVRNNSTSATFDNIPSSSRVGTDKDGYALFTPPNGTTTYKVTYSNNDGTVSCPVSVSVESNTTSPKDCDQTGDKNGIDDDNDGQIDEGCTQITTPRDCNETGIKNGLDDDNDGQIDEGCPTITTSSRCPYFTKYVRLGGDGEYTGSYVPNDQYEVNLIKHFLHEYRGENLNAMGGYNGIYTEETNRAVRRFQEYYVNQVLVPWLNPEETSWYKTTRILANWLMGCKDDPQLLRDDISPLPSGGSYVYEFDYSGACRDSSGYPLQYSANSYGSKVFNLLTPTSYYCSQIPDYCSMEGTPKCVKPGYNEFVNP